MEFSRSSLIQVTYRTMSQMCALFFTVASKLHIS